MVETRELIIMYTLLFISTLTVMAGATIAPVLPAMQTHFMNIDNYILLSGLAVTIPGLFVAIGSPFSGSIIDVFGRKKLLVSSLLIYAAAGTAGFILNNLTLIIVSRAILGIGTAGITASVTTLISDYYEGEQRDKVMGLQGSFMALGGVIFVYMGGVLGNIGWNYAFLIYATAFLLFPLGLIYLYEPEKTITIPNTETKSESEDDEDLPYLSLGLLYVQSFVYLSLIYGVIITVGNYLIIQNPTITTGQIGITISAVSFTGFLVSLRYKNIRSTIGEYGIFALIYFFLALGLILASISQNYVTVTLSIVLMAIGTGMNWPNSNLFVINRVPERYKGRAISFIYSFAFFGQFVAPLFTNPLVDQLGINGFYALGGGLYGLIAIGHFILRIRKN